MDKNIFKRMLIILLALLMCLSGCGKNEESEHSGSAMDYTIEGIPEFVPTADKFTDTNKKYVLPDGYLYEYLPDPRAFFVNMADPSDESWVSNTRIKSDGTDISEEGLYVSNFIPCKIGDIIRVKNADAVYNQDGTGAVNWCYYDENKNIIAPMSPYNDKSGKITWNEKGEIESAEIGYTHGKENPDLAYIRITLHVDEESNLDSVIITVNEEIKYVDSGSFKWTKTEQYIPKDWYDEIEDATTKINKLYKSEERNVVFIATTDIHVLSQNEAYIGNIGKVSAEIMHRCNIPFFISLGDFSTQSSRHELSVFEEGMEVFFDIISPVPKGNMLVTVGNHDGATGQKEIDGEIIYYRHQLNNEQRSKLFFGWQRETNPDKQFGADGTYYYLDDENTKTRYIMLNSFWSEWEGDPKTGYVEDVQHSFMQTPIYGQEQLSWFANEALNMPKGYSAIIGTHYASKPMDFEMLRNIINAYVNRTDFSGSYIGEQVWQSSYIEVDYSSAKGELIAIFQGHTHVDEVYTDIFEIPCINITTTGAFHDVRDEKSNERIQGTATEIAFDVVTVDKNNRVIYLTRVGAGSDRRIEY